MVIERTRGGSIPRLIGIPDQSFLPYALDQGCQLPYGITTRHCWAAAAAMLVNWNERRRPGLSADDLVNQFDQPDGIGVSGYTNALARIAPMWMGSHRFYSPQCLAWSSATRELIAYLEAEEPVLTLVGSGDGAGPNHVVLATKAVISGYEVHHLTVFDPWRERRPISQDLDQIHAIVVHWGSLQPGRARPPLARLK